MIPPSHPNPYVGPRAFQEGETLYGRDREAGELLDLLISERIVLLYSPSGAGKTSLLRAALIPELKQEGFQVLPVIRVSLEPPPDFDLPSTVNRYILSTLLSLEEELPPEQQTSLQELTGMELAAYLEQRETEAAETDGAVLIFDQFEEILTVDHVDQQAKAEFFAQLGKTLHDRHRWALFSMREEYSGSLDPYLRPVPTRLNTTFRLGLLKEKAARQTIREPAREAGVPFTDAAAIKLSDDLRRTEIQQSDGTVTKRVDPYIEPVQLQVVCHRLWEALPENATEIRETDIQEAGDVDSALAGYYAGRIQAGAQETGVQERAIREWFERHLISEGGFRRQVLQGSEQSQGLDNRTIEFLVDAYLVRTENRRGSTWYELAHDRLIKPVKENNTDWRERHLGTLQRQAALWGSRERPTGLLLRDEALKETEDWADKHQDELTSTERDFLAASQGAQAITERERRQTRRIRKLAIVATAISIIAIIGFLGAIYFFYQARNETDRAHKAETTATNEAENARRAEAKAKKERARSTSRELAMAAISNLEADPELSVLLAVQALSVDYTIEAENALRQALQTSRVERTLLGHADTVSSVAFSSDGTRLATASWDGTVKIWDLISEKELFTIKAGTRVYEVSFSPDGTRLVTANADRTAKVWDAGSGQLLQTFSGHKDRVWGGVFSPDGTYLATASRDGTAKVWNLASGEELQTLSGHVKKVRGVAFSPDGKRLATASDDKTIRIWDIFSGKELRIIEVGSEINSVAFSPDGMRLAADGQDGRARVWDISDTTSSDLLLTLLGHNSSIYDIIFSPDGKRLATASFDRNAKVWDASSGQELLTLSGHTDWIWDTAFSPNGKRLATASSDRSAKMWNVDVSRELLTLSGHADQVHNVTFSPDGIYLATASDDGTAKVWEATSGQELLTLSGHMDKVPGIAFNPDGTRLATASADGTAKVWDAASGRELLTLSGHSGWVYSVVFSPDETGTHLVTSGGDNTVKVWDSASGRELLTLSGHTGKIRGVVFSPTGTYLATASDDGTAKVWDPISGQNLLTLSGHTDWVLSVTFSPDGTRLATTSQDGTAKMWDAASGQVLHSFSGHNDRVWDIAFSPDGTRLATASADGTAKVWEAASPYRELKTLPGHEGAVFRVAFSPDGKYLATAGLDGTARLYVLNLDELMTLARKRVTRFLQLEECQRFLHQEECPTAP
ncbi:MAG: hypothetical protein GY801_22670 [bacterium]|nr:hypothetical protein [bacterium]